MQDGRILDGLRLMNPFVAANAKAVDDLFADEIEPRVRNLAARSVDPERSCLSNRGLSSKLRDIAVGYVDPWLVFHARGLSCDGRDAARPDGSAGKRAETCEEAAGLLIVVVRSVVLTNVLRGGEMGSNATRNTPTVTGFDSPAR